MMARLRQHASTLIGCGVGSDVLGCSAEDRVTLCLSSPLSCRERRLVSSPRELYESVVV